MSVRFCSIARADAELQANVEDADYAEPTTGPAAAELVGREASGDSPDHPRPHKRTESAAEADSDSIIPIRQWKWAASAPAPEEPRDNLPD